MVVLGGRERRFHFNARDAGGVMLQMGVASLTRGLETSRHSPIFRSLAPAVRFGYPLATHERHQVFQFLDDFSEGQEIPVLAADDFRVFLGFWMIEVESLLRQLGFLGCFLCSYRRWKPISSVCPRN